MRPDMNKVIVERPRVGRRFSRVVKPGRPLRDPESAPGRGPMRDPKTRTKELNENLAPLVRYLSSRVGYRWDDVYSDISRHLRPTNAVQQHVRDHVRGFVALHVCFRGGEPHELGRFGVSVARGFYVCPNTGTLCEYGHPMKGYRQKRQKRGCRCAECRQRIAL